MRTKIEAHGRTNYIHRYESLSEFLPVALRGNYGGRFNSHGDSGRASKEDSAAYVMAGANLHSPEVRAAVELLNKVDATVHGRTMDTWEPDVYGGYPIVPEYMMGCPENMRNRRPSENSRAPVRIVVETAKSGGLSTEAQLRRGAAIAALAQRMSEERPTELCIMRLSQNFMISGADVYGYLLRLDTCPVNLPQMAAIFTSQSWTAALGWNWGESVSRGDRHHINTAINFAYGVPGHGMAASVKEAIIRDLFALEPQDIVFQGGFLCDNDLLERNPVEWVNRQLQKQRNIED